MMDRYRTKSIIIAATAAVLSAGWHTRAAKAQPAGPGVIAQAPATPEDPDEAVRRDLREQRDILFNPNATAQQRDDAAARLVSRQRRDADAVLLEVINNVENREGRLAVARALATDATPNPEFIEPLGQLLGAPEAAQALANYKDNERARTLLQLFVKNASISPRERTSATRAMAKLFDKSTAAFLIDRLSDPDENQLVQTAAVEALQGMTGYAYSDVQRWQQWWRLNQNRPEIDWLVDRLNLNATLKSDAERRLDQLRGYAERLIKEDYQKASNDEKARVLLATLNSDSEDVRVLGLNILLEEVATGQAGTYQKVADTLRGMVGDSSWRVRQAAARTLGLAGATAGDEKAVDALLAQVAQESNKDVLQEMLSALGFSRDLRTVNLLLNSLNDDSFTVAQAAAESLGKLSEKLREPANAPTAQLVAVRLRDRLRDTRDNVAATKLRETIVDAMANLAHPILLQQFVQLLNSDSIRIRGWAYQGLGRIGNPDSANDVVRGLSDQAPGVRLYAIEALGAVGGFGRADVLGRLLDPSVERDPQVRQKAWDVIVTLLKKAPRGEDLDLWVQRLRGTNTLEAHQRREKVLEIQEAKLAAQPGSERNLAIARTSRGEELLALAEVEKSPPASAEYALQAATKMDLALQYYLAQRANVNELLPRAQAKMKALVLAGKYTDAVAFANDIQRQLNGFTEDAIGITEREVERLKAARRLDEALQLVEAGKKLPLNEFALRRLNKAEEQIRQLRTSGGYLWISPYLARQDSALAEDISA